MNFLDISGQSSVIGESELLEAENLEISIARVDQAFYRQCVKDDEVAHNQLIRAIAVQVMRLEKSEPELSEAERLIVAKRLIQQMLNIYHGHLSRFF